MSDEKVKVFLERIQIFLEDSDWLKADEYCEKVLDIEPHNAEAYLGKLMVSLKVAKQDELNQCNESFEENVYFKKIERYGEEALVAKLRADIQAINSRNEAKKKAEKEANNRLMKSVKKFCCIGIALFFTIVIIVKVASSIHDAQAYKKAVSFFESSDYEAAIAIFSELDDYKDAQEMIGKSQQKIKEVEEKLRLEEEEKKRQEEARKEQARKEQEQREKQKIYDEAEAYLDKGDKANSAITFGQILDFKDAKERCFELWVEVADRKTVDSGLLTTVAVQNYGAVTAVGYKAEALSKWTGVTDISISLTNTNVLALKRDGSVESYGDYSYDVTSWENIVQVAAGPYHGVGLKADGTVVSTSCKSNSQITLSEGMTKVSSWNNIVSVKVGYNFTVGLRANGTVVTTSSYFEKLRTWTDIVAISAGNFYVIGLKADGTVVFDKAPGTGENGECDVSGWKNIVAISAGSYHTIGVTSNGTVVATRYKNDPTANLVTYYGQCNVGGIKNAIDVAAGVNNTIILKSDGTVVAIGSNSDGQCNVKNWKDIKKP